MSARVMESLNQALHRAMREHSEMIVLGEDIRDPYSGAFKVTRGLSTAFPDRVLTTPISEAAIVGLGTGLALHGFRPVVEIMFGDFITLIADQLINHAAKIRWMYGRSVPVPLVIRTPMGGRRGYGPTHSQSLERLFLGVPGLKVVAVSPLADPGALLRAAIDGEEPVLFIENKLLYARPVLARTEPAGGTPAARGEETVIEGMRLMQNGQPFPVCRLAPEETPDVTLATYGGMTPLALEAAARLRREEGLVCEVIVPHQLAPWDRGELEASVRTTRRLVVIEEGTRSWGWGAEVLAQLAGVQMEAPPQRVAARELPIPAARAMEDQVLPQVGAIVEAAIRTVDTVLN